jgi:PKD domain
MRARWFEAHTWRIAGVGLILMLASGCGDTPTTPGTTSPPPPAAASPKACFTTVPNPPVVDVGQTIELDASCSENAGASPSFGWNLGNGQSASGRSVQAVYGEAANFTVQLTLDNGGQSSTMDKEVVVRPRPTACFAYEQLLGADGGQSPCTIRFDSSCAGGDVAEYRWFFQGSPFPPSPPPDKNVTTAEPTIANSWSDDRECIAFRPFERKVSLTVVDERGITDTREETIQFRTPFLRR